MVFYSLHLKKAPCSLVILHFSDHVQSRLGWFIVPKVLKYLVSMHFSIHVDPRTSPSEKISIFFEIYYQDKHVEVLPSKLPSSDLGQSECGSKNP